MQKRFDVIIAVNRVALIMTTAVLITACAGIRGTPERPSFQEAEIKYIGDHYGANVNAVYAELSEQDKPGFRNEVIDGRIALIDMYFNEYKLALMQEEAAKNILIDLAVIGINTAGIFAAASLAKNIMAAVSAALVGSRTKVDEALFYRNTIVALIAKMEEQRREKELQIRQRMPEGVDTYPLRQALRDVEKYFWAGTINESLYDITKEAGAKAKEIDGVLEVMRNAKFSTPDIRRKVAQVLALVDGLEKSRAIALANRPPVQLEPSTEQIIARGFPGKAWISDKSENGLVAKAALKQMIGLSPKSRANLDVWEAALKRR